MRSWSYLAPARLSDVTIPLSISFFVIPTTLPFPSPCALEGFRDDTPVDTRADRREQTPSVFCRGKPCRDRSVRYSFRDSTGQSSSPRGEKGCNQNIRQDNWDIFRNNLHRTLLPDASYSFLYTVVFISFPDCSENLNIFFPEIAFYFLIFTSSIKKKNK